MQKFLFWGIAIIAVSAGFWQIDAPFIDRWSWRQTDVAAIARNYFENGFGFAWPQIDWAGDQAGYVGTEFPILPFTAALLYKIFGVHEWIGRTISLFFFAISLPAFFAIGRRAIGETPAIFGLIFYAFAPLMIMTSRAFMPDMASLSLALIGLYYFWDWIDRGTATLRTADYDPPLERVSPSGNVYFSLAALTLSLLIKPTNIVIAAAFAVLAFQRFGYSAFRRIELWIFAIAAIAPSALWYWHAHEIAQHFYPYHFFGAGGVRIMKIGWYWHILVLTFTSTLTPVVFVLALIGLLLFFSHQRPPLPTNEPHAPLHAWGAGMILFIILVGYGNRHQWYQLPLVPIATIYAGLALSWIMQKTNRYVALLTIIGFFAFVIFYSAQFLAPSALSLWRLGSALNECTPPNALIVCADEGHPTALYYAHRKGWHYLEDNGIYYGNPTDDAQLTADLETLRRRGATHLAFYSGNLWWITAYRQFAAYLDGNARLLDASSDYRIYELNK